MRFIIGTVFCPTGTFLVPEALRTFSKPIRFFVFQVSLQMVSCSFLIFALVLSVITANAAEKKFELRLEPGTNPNADPQMASYNIAKVNLKSEFDKLTNSTGLVEFGQHVKTAFKSETLKAGVREQTRNRVNDPITIITGSPFRKSPAIIIAINSFLYFFRSC